MTLPILSQYRAVDSVHRGSGSTRKESRVRAPRHSLVIAEAPPCWSKTARSVLRFERFAITTIGNFIRFCYMMKALQRTTYGTTSTKTTHRTSTTWLKAKEFIPPLTPFDQIGVGIPGRINDYRTKGDELVVAVLARLDEAASHHSERGVGSRWRRGRSGLVSAESGCLIGQLAQRARPPRMHENAEEDQQELLHLSERPPSGRRSRVVREHWGTPGHAPRSLACLIPRPFRLQTAARPPSDTRIEGQPRQGDIMTSTVERNADRELKAKHRKLWAAGDYQSCPPS
jgi:hypothetical protein